jgi:hypothetical protein
MILSRLWADTDGVSSSIISGDSDLLSILVAEFFFLPGD